MMRSCSSLNPGIRWLVGGCLWLLCTVGTAKAADPFYARLVEDGIRAFDRGDYPTAAKDLKLGCFGWLEEPNGLARCLVYLAVSQGEIADVPAFSRTFDRIVEVERMFQAFSKLEPNARLTRALETHVESLVPYEVLARSPIFSHVARRQREAQIRAMEPVERRLVLEAKVVAEPDHPTWRLLLADLDLAAGDFESARVSSESVFGTSAAVGLGGLHSRTGDRWPGHV